MEFVVGAERDQAAEGDANGVEHLSGGVHPHLSEGQCYKIRSIWVEWATQNLLCTPQPPWLNFWHSHKFTLRVKFTLDVAKI